MGPGGGESPEAARSPIAPFWRNRPSLVRQGYPRWRNRATIPRGDLHGLQAVARSRGEDATEPNQIRSRPHRAAPSALVPQGERSCRRYRGEVRMQCRDGVQFAEAERRSPEETATIYIAEPYKQATGSGPLPVTRS